MNLNEYTALFLFCLTLSPLMLVLAGSPAGLLIIWGYFFYKIGAAAFRRHREDLWYHSRRGSFQQDPYGADLPPHPA